MKKITLEREKCIGCGACVAVCPDHWEMAEDGKARLLGATENDEGNMEKEVKEVGCNEDAAQGCPVQIIHID